MILLQYNTIAKAHKAQETVPDDIGIEERLGEYVPIDLIFNDENNKRVSLKQIVNKPTIVALVYYHCSDVCSLFLNGVADVINKLELYPGKDYSVLTISFDDRETPELARQKKRDYISALQKSFPEESWKFLTGDKDAISKFTDAVGFKFRRKGKDFLHPLSLIILSADGKIVRYLYDQTFLPFDIKMALIEASQGNVGITRRSILRYCFSYDPKSRRYMFNFLKVVGTVILLFAITFFVYLTFRKKAGGK